MTVQDTVTMNDIKRFFVSYIQNDNLGLIATAHKIHADLSSKGVLSEKCIQLAKLHSLAVDFPKTGVPADYDSQKYHVQTYPDFIGRNRKNQYLSQKALGKMYREAKATSFRPEYDDINVDRTFLVDGFEEYVSEAVLIKQNFDFDLVRLMRQFSVRSEFEITTQLFLDYNINSGRGEFEVRKRLNDIVKSMTKQYQTLFWSENVKTDSKKGLLRRLDGEHMKKASAWYFVTYAYAALRGEERNLLHHRPLISFPWLTVSDALMEVSRRKRYGQVPAYSEDVKQVITRLRSDLRPPRSSKHKLLRGSMPELVNGIAHTKLSAVQSIDETIDNLSDTVYNHGPLKKDSDMNASSMVSSYCKIVDDMFLPEESLTDKNPSSAIGMISPNNNKIKLEVEKMPPDLSKFKLIQPVVDSVDDF